jgi:hypothetical protein
MAITGTGIAGDPYLVHNYSEIKEACARIPQNGNMIYVSLMNDIDCNSYGNGWEWETVTLGVNVNYGANFNLNGHTIKNVMIKRGNSLFKGFCFNNRSILKNGKILNVFGNNHKNIFEHGNNSNGTYWLIQDISLSIDNTSGTDAAFCYTKFENCAIYFITNNLLSNLSISYGSNYQYKNCDCYFEIKNRTYTLFYDAGYNNNTFDNCRVIAKVKGLGNGMNNDVFFRQGTAGFTNCVVDITGYTASDGYSFFNSGCTGVLNKEHFGIGDSQESATHDYSSLYGLTAVTTEEMETGNSLREKGFVVVNVSE